MNRRNFIYSLGLVTLSLPLIAKLPKIRRLGPVRRADCWNLSIEQLSGEYNMGFSLFHEKETNIVYKFGLGGTTDIEKGHARQLVTKVDRFTPEGLIEVREFKSDITIYRKLINQWGELGSSEILTEPPKIIVTWREMEEI